MAFIPVPRGASLCFHFTSSGQNWQFCFTVQKDSGDISSADLDVLAAAGDGWYHGTGGPIESLGPGNSINNVTATDLSTDGGPQSIVTHYANGGAGTAALSSSTAAVASLRTGKRGRSYRGRVYFGGFPTNALLTPGYLTTGFVADLVNYVEDLKLALEVLGFSLVVASKQHNKVVTNPAAVNVVTDVVVDQAFDSQRRRLVGRGS